VLTFESFLNESVHIPNLIKDKNFLKFIDDEFGEGYSNIENIEDLNDGYCILVAKYLKKQYPNSEFWTIGNPMSYHVAIKINNKFYDAVDTDGVDSIEDLQWATNVRRPLNPKKGIIYNH
jgi:hypothetical protein